MNVSGYPARKYSFTFPMGMLTCIKLAWYKPNRSRKLGYDGSIVYLCWDCRFIRKYWEDFLTWINSNLKIKTLPQPVSRSWWPCLLQVWTTLQPQREPRLLMYPSPQIYPSQSISEWMHQDSKKNLPVVKLIPSPTDVGNATKDIICPLKRSKLDTTDIYFSVILLSWGTLLEDTPYPHWFYNYIIKFNYHLYRLTPPPTLIYIFLYLLENI